LDNFWTDKNTQRLEKLKQMDWSWEDIAEDLGCHSEQARSKWRRMGEDKERDVPDLDWVKKETIDENHQVMAFKSTDGSSIEDLLKEFGVDLDIWKVDHYIINKWEVGRKATTKHLTFEHGVIDGEVEDEGGINVEPLKQVKVWLVRIVPVAIKPHIQPIEITSELSEHIPEKSFSKVHTALILPDSQIGFSRDIRTGKLTPFHDREAISIALSLAESLKPDVTIWLGDVVDFTMWTDKFIRKPEFYFTTQPALIEAAWLIGQTKQYSGEVYMLEGNHEQRTEKMMITHLLDAYGLTAADSDVDMPAMSVDNLLGLSRMGVKYVGDYENAEVWLNTELRCVHGNVARGGLMATSRSILESSSISTIFGHIHRIESASKTITGAFGRKVIQAISAGCLCKTDGSVPGSNHEVQWQNAVAVVEYDDGGNFTVHTLPIHQDNTLVYNGNYYEPWDYMQDMKLGTTWDWQE
jgi:hypothetical protein